MPRGGARPGAGRKTNAEREEIRTAGARKLQRFAEKALDDLDAIYEAQKDLALGVYYEGCSNCSKELKSCRCKEPAEVKVYRRPPDQRAGAELLQHAKGRAAQAQQVAPETNITVSLGCKRCGGYEPLVPRPPAMRKDGGDDGGKGPVGGGSEGGEPDQGGVGPPEGDASGFANGDTRG